MHWGFSPPMKMVKLRTGLAIVDPIVLPTLLIAIKISPFTAKSRPRNKARSTLWVSPASRGLAMPSRATHRLSPLFAAKHGGLDPSPAKKCEKKEVIWTRKSPGVPKKNRICLWKFPRVQRISCPRSDYHRRGWSETSLHQNGALSSTKRWEKDIYDTSNHRCGTRFQSWIIPESYPCVLSRASMMWPIWDPYCPIVNLVGSSMTDQPLWFMISYPNMVRPL